VSKDHASLDLSIALPINTITPSKLEGDRIYSRKYNTSKYSSDQIKKLLEESKMEGNEELLETYRICKECPSERNLQNLYDSLIKNIEEICLEIFPYQK
jgi:hypothetical protein